MHSAQLERSHFAQTALRFCRMAIRRIASKAFARARRAARAVRALFRPRTCCVPHCDTLMALVEVDCGHGTCIQCVANSLEITRESRRLFYSCCQCRKKHLLNKKGEKKIFCDGVPSHAKTIRTRCGWVFSVAHLPCRENDCYECEHSEIVKNIIRIS